MISNFYIVATPIGNLQDISFRTLDVLNNVDFVLCEDTRKTGSLLKLLREKYGLYLNRTENPVLISFYEQNEISRIPNVLNLLKNGQSVALVSDAGTPALSDPGYKLIRECIGQGIKIEVIPGPTSITTALLASGMPTDKFMFVGFLPKKEGHRKKMLENIKLTLEIIKQTVIIFEAPHKTEKTLAEMMRVFGDVEVVITRELTKIHQEVKKDKISNLLNFYSKTKPKGELVIVFNL